MKKKVFLSLCIYSVAILALTLSGFAQNLQLKIFKVRAADTKNIYNAIEPMKSGQGKITFDEATQSIIVYDTPDAIERVQRIIQELDMPARQVTIEVTTIESTQEDISRLGISGLHAVIPKGEFIVILASGGRDRSEKIHARTQITTLENQKASIHLTEDAVIGTETTVVYPDFVTTTPLRSTTGQTLDVIAMVNSDNTISLNVEPSLRTMHRGNIEEGSLSTHVTVNEGDAIVIGMCDMRSSGSTTKNLLGFPASRSHRNVDKKLVTLISAKITK